MRLTSSRVLTLPGPLATAAERRDRATRARSSGPGLGRRPDQLPGHLTWRCSGCPCSLLSWRWVLRQRQMRTSERPRQREAATSTVMTTHSQTWPGWGQLYMIPYSDLCEQRGGRKRLYAVRFAKKSRGACLACFSPCCKASACGDAQFSQTTRLPTHERLPLADLRHVQRKWGFWKWLIRRLGLKLVKTTELPPDKSYVCVCCSG